MSSFFPLGLQILILQMPGKEVIYKVWIQSSTASMINSERSGSHILSECFDLQAVVRLSLSEIFSWNLELFFMRSTKG